MLPLFFLYRSSGDFFVRPPRREPWFHRFTFVIVRWDFRAVIDDPIVFWFSRHLRPALGEPIFKLGRRLSLHAPDKLIDDAI